MYSVASGTLSNKRRAEAKTSGLAEKKISTAMKHDASGSQPAQPYTLVSAVETITERLPKVSAMMWR